MKRSRDEGSERSLSTRLLVVVAVVAVVATACSGGGSGSSSSAAPTGGVLKIGSNSTVDSTNPFVAINQDSGTLFQQMYPFLIQYATKTLQFAPDFATKWDESSDGLTWTFHTVSGAKWSDGKPLTAKDAAWTLNTIIKFANGPTGSVAANTADLTSVKATDANTLVLKYDRPVANVLAKLSSVAILPEHIWAPYATGDGKGLRTYPNTPSTASPVVAGGPFELVRYTQNQDAILQDNPNFYGPKPKIQGFGLVYFSNNDAEIQALKSGDIDAVENIPTTAIRTLSADKDITIYTGPGIGFKDLIINSSPDKTTNLELQNPLVREAMEYAIDRNQIVQTAWLGHATPGTTIVTPSTPLWHDSSIQGLPFDIAKANALLNQAGYPMGSNGIRVANGHPMSYQILFATDETGEGSRAFSIIQNGFREIGIDVTQRTMDDTALNAAIYGTNSTYNSFDLAMWDWTDTGIDPDFILAALTCAQRGDWSDTGYCNKTYDKLYAEQGTAIHVAQRQQIVDRMQQIIYNARPYIVLNYNETLNAWSNKWTGFVESPEGWFNGLSKESLEQAHQT